MENILVLSGLAAVAFFAGRLFDRLRRRPDAIIPKVLLAAFASALFVWMMIRGFTRGWTTPTILLAALGLFALVGRLDAIRRRRQAAKH